MPDVVDIPIKVVGLPDLVCANSLVDFLNQLPNLIVGQAPTSITNIVVGNVQPLDTQRDTIWFRKDNAGNFIGIYVYSAGTWQQMFPMPGQIFPHYRQSTDPTTDPVGYTRVDNAVGVPAAVVTQLQTQWVADGANPGYYLRDDVVFTGF